MLGLMGKKLGMTQVFAEGGEVTGVSVVKLGPCTVVQKKTVKTDGYNALQIGFGGATPKRLQRSRRGHFEKKSLPLFTNLMEFRTDHVDAFEVGEELCAAGFKAGDEIAVSGTTKGRGFQGVMKRHGKHGGPASHGSDFHRRPGSIGMRTWPGHVLKNMKMPGHMGNVHVTTKNLRIVAVRPQDDIVLVSGAIPGAKNGMVVVVPADKTFEKRPELKRAVTPTAGSEQKPQEEKKE